MDKHKFTEIYNESRNGANEFYRHPLARTTAYSDGVQALGDVGCFWLIDIFCTEIPKVLRNQGEQMLVLTVKVKAGKAKITATGSGDRVIPWSKKIDYTDMPDGDWVFYMADDDEGPTPFRLILPTEY